VAFPRPQSPALAPGPRPLAAGPGRRPRSAPTLCDEQCSSL